jgi:predicted nucleic acid-binding protein
LAKKTFAAEWPEYFTVEVTSALCRQAGELAERYRLRAYDAVHLAAFAEIAREAGVRETRFSSFDKALNRAHGCLPARRPALVSRAISPLLIPSVDQRRLTECG